ncbi:hypothetical protein VIGAN_01429500 [Vigna angularis var. angularis]|uniref:Uncharacterized protein n=1 Tax=Vigna angularis var. angularis TaxID=157739 RepID=A0A0S3R6R6_PHAAN|nr:hypothetical protein VIGAN_01429500 [Vigna angularis var. angularis]
MGIVIEINLIVLQQTPSWSCRRISPELPTPFHLHTNQRLAIPHFIHQPFNGTTSIEHVQKSKRGKAVTRTQNLHRRNSKHLVFQHLKGHRQSHIARKHGELPRVVSVQRAITVPIAITGSLRNQMHITTSHKPSDGSRTRVMKRILPLSRTPRSPLAVINSQHPSELVHVPYFQ